MEGYQGEFDVDINQTEFKDYTPSDWAMYFIESYGQIDGAHHKLWVLDQVARVLKGTSVIVKLAKWDNGESEYRISLGEPSKQYNQWVRECLEIDANGEAQYDYDIGIAP